ncbi:MAG: hypothetical protein P1U87_19290 [Verrucomicrobiales bacterium]|nr:hypothetical protein [Verrucomicrobiales bacterium]
MTPTCQPGMILLAQISEFRIPEFLLRWSESPFFTIHLAMIAAGLVGLFFGWLIGRSGKAEKQASSEPKKTDDNPELQWRHEKLILMERQDAEKQERLVKMVEDLGHAPELSSTEIKARLFRVAETLRDIRQRVGTDLSRLTLVSRQLSGGSEDSSHSSAQDACLEIAESHIKRLEEARNQLRPVCSELIALEESFPTGLVLGDSEKKKLKDALILAKKRIKELPSDWRILTDDADRKIGELLKVEKSPKHKAIREILLVDGSVTDSLDHRDDSPLRADLDAIIDLLGEAQPQPLQGNPFEKSFPVHGHEVPPKPDNGFRAPPEKIAPSNGNGTHSPEAAEEPVSPPEAAETGEPKILVVFRSNDVNLWGQEVYRSANARARDLTELPDWANWISIRRVDTGEAVFAPSTSLSFSNSELEASSGFNASNELFYGARHLGMYAESVPNEVETRFTYGGWGFGHRVSEADAGRESLQASGWEGKEIDSETVFEIVLLEVLPELTKQDRLLDTDASVIPR